MFPSLWKPGHAFGYYDNIPNNEQCKQCQGSGEDMTKHQFGIGYSHIPCSKCYGSGRNVDANPTSNNESDSNKSDKS